MLYIHVTAPLWQYPSIFESRPPRKLALIPVETAWDEVEGAAYSIIQQSLASRSADKLKIGPPKYSRCLKKLKSLESQELMKENREAKESLFAATMPQH